MNRLQDKVAIVTGTGPLIGGAIAAGLAAEGARVVCTGLDEDAVRPRVSAIEKAGGEAVAALGDVTDPAHAREVVELAAARWGRVDILVNNAMWFHKRGLLTMTVENYRRQLDVILGGAFLFTREVAQHMIGTGRRGSVINILSTAAWQGEPGNIGYSTGKSGLINFTRSAAMELARHGIRVNGFTPTATLPDDPEQARELAEKMAAAGEYRMDFQGLLPMGRLPTPQDYVPAVVFLASDESSMITGSNITVDGGATAKYWPWLPGSEGERTA
ncbi:SDR family NAD(P)-dependent oxidoreductase [Streptomyces soliscabiei]|uniref:SDR family NAD(P)-dependent oxidoreductase n=1 Tax=Streptomyces soliscabiei TaxID=588897 RepID=UPI0029BDF521|nr:SDR family oxidoreductase [Streptomyces sp. NY05-11A]MDX2675082.1 SDR family oxidoreductase [Streptomyces sp. NY05-11A]